MSHPRPSIHDEPLQCGLSFELWYKRKQRLNSSGGRNPMNLIVCTRWVTNGAGWWKYVPPNRHWRCVIISRLAGANYLPQSVRHCSGQCPILHSTAPFLTALLSSASLAKLTLVGDVFYTVCTTSKRVRIASSFLLFISFPLSHFLRRDSSSRVYVRRQMHYSFCRLIEHCYCHNCITATSHTRVFPRSVPFL